MKKYISIFFFFLMAYVANATQTDSLTVDVGKATLTVKGLLIQQQTPISKVINLLGKPSRILSVAKMERVFIYDSLGLTFEIGKDASKRIERITASLNPKGNNRIAQAMFKGVITMNGLLVTSTTSSDQISKKTPIKEFNCFSTICSSVQSKYKLNLIMDFTDETQKKLMDVVFIIKH